MPFLILSRWAFAPRCLMRTPVWRCVFFCRTLWRALSRVGSGVFVPGHWKHSTQPKAELFRLMTAGAFAKTAWMNCLGFFLNPTTIF